MTRKTAKLTYEFVCADLAGGLNYSIAAQLYNRCMRAIGSRKRVEQSVSAHKFATDFYAAWNKGSKV